MSDNREAKVRLVKFAVAAHFVLTVGMASFAWVRSQAALESSQEADKTRQELAEAYQSAVTLAVEIRALAAVERMPGYLAELVLIDKLTIHISEFAMAAPERADSMAERLGQAYAPLLIERLKILDESWIPLIEEHVREGRVSVEALMGVQATLDELRELVRPASFDRYSYLLMINCAHDLSEAMRLATQGLHQAKWSELYESAEEMARLARSEQD